MQKTNHTPDLGPSRIVEALPVMRDTGAAQWSCTVTLYLSSLTGPTSPRLWFRGGDKGDGTCGLWRGQSVII